MLYGRGFVRFAELSDGHLHTGEAERSNCIAYKTDASAVLAWLRRPGGFLGRLVHVGKPGARGLIPAEDGDRAGVLAEQRQLCGAL